VSLKKGNQAGGGKEGKCGSEGEKHSIRDLKSSNGTKQRDRRTDLLARRVGGGEAYEKAGRKKITDQENHPPCASSYKRGGRKVQLATVVGTNYKHHETKGYRT